jgi:predicted enzyme related to lactoylglutathione lyase
MPARKKTTRKATRKTSRNERSPVRTQSAKKAPARRSSSASQPAAPPASPSGIGAMSHHFDYTTHDPEAIQRFYTQILGFKNFNRDPNFNYLYVQTGPSSSLGFMPPMPEMGEASPAKEPTLYFMVKDVDRAYESLAAKGVMFEGPPADMPWGHRVVRTADPEGRTVMLAQPKKT